jgi:iron(III) transport system permease protein
MRTWSLVLNTFLLSGAVCAISLPLGAVWAWLLVRTDLPGRKAALTLLTVQLFVPLYLQAAAWQACFGLEGWSTLIWGPTMWVTGWTGAIWVHAAAALPWIVLMAGAGLALIAPGIEEQALLDGSCRQVVSRVTLPNSLAALGAAAIWAAVVTAGEMTVTDLFGVRTYAEEVYTQQAATGEPYTATLAVLPGVLLTALLVLGGLVICARLAARDRPLDRGRPLMFPLGRWRWPAAAAVTVSLGALAGVPLLSLCYKAGVQVTQLGDQRVRSWSLMKLMAMVASSPFRFRREFFWSLLTAGLAAFGAVVAGLILAWMARDRRRVGGPPRRAWHGARGLPPPAPRPLLPGTTGSVRTAVVFGLIALCLAVPGPLLGLGVIWLLDRPGWPTLNYLYDQWIAAPLMVQTIRGLGPAALILWHAVQSLPGELLDCAALDGAGPLATVWRVVLPCRRSAVALAWLVAFAVALADLAATILVVPPGMATLPVHVFGLLHAGVEDQVAGICLAQVLLFALLAAVCRSCFSRSNR